MFCDTTVSAQKFSSDGPKNLIKWTPAPLAPPYKRIALSYERVLTPSMSINLRIAPGLSGGLPFQNLIDRTSGEFGLLSADFNYGSLDITPELRFYTSKEKGAPRGFYIGPFFRYSRFKMDASAGEFVNDNDGETYIGDFDGKLTLLGGGMILGFQGLIGDAFVIDFNFGPGWGASTFDAIISNVNGGTQEKYAEYANDAKEEFDNFVEDTPLERFITLETSSDANSGTAKGKFGLPIIRLGLSFGYAF